MSKKKKTNRPEGPNYWQSIADMMTALLMIFILLLLFFGLQTLLVNETEEDDERGDRYEDEYDGIDGEGEYKDPGDYDEEGRYEEPPEDGGGGGEGEAEEEHLYDEPPGGGGGNGPGMYPGDGVKSAVYVVMVDAETDRTIKEEGVEFELYGADNSLQILNTYYPVRISYKKYETTEEGVFYLPEKIWQGEYYMHEITEPEGYDAAPNQNFVIDELYDWPEPFVVRMPLTPSKNVVRIQMNDSATNQGISGGTFDIIAQEDIYTQDGTLRYKAGQIADTVTCNASGYAESEELYLGKYTIRQRQIPQYYASVLEDVETEVKKKTKVQPPTNVITSEKTKLIVKVSDELYPERPVAGAEFTVTGAGTSRTFTTDDAGEFIVDDINKNTTYQITQTSAPDDYQAAANSQPVAVSLKGRFNDDTDTQETIELTNRVIRVSIGVKERFRNTFIEGKSVALYNEDDTQIDKWTTTAMAKTETGLAPGTYHVVVDDDEEHPYVLNVTDTAQVQELTITFITAASIMIAVGAGILGIGILIGVIMALRYLLGKRKQKAAERH